MIGRIRRAGAGDEAIVRDVRLQALADSPDDFDATLARESTFTEGDWRRFVARGATFVYEETDGPMGLAAGIPHWDDPSAVGLVAMWVHPARRGTGAADALVDAVLAWARERKARAVRLDVLESNVRSRRFYERMGFRTTGRRPISERTGLADVEMRLELEEGS